MYTARVYKNTGFNGINIPSSPSALESAGTYADFPALDVLTDVGLECVKLHGSKSDFENIDYVKIGGVYYNVFGIPTPLNGDTWQIPLTLDGVLTAGGVSNLEFLDGVTTRASTATDNFGEFCIEDELLTPSEPLQLDVRPISVDNKTTNTDDGVVPNPNWSQNTLVETTLDLGLMACVDGSVEYVDEAGNQVIVPHSYPKLGASTRYSFAGLDGVDTKTTVYPVPENDSGDNIIHEGIQKARALGIESAIFNQVAIPSTFAYVDLNPQQIYEGLDGAECSFLDESGNQHIRGSLGKYNEFGLYEGFSTYYYAKEIRALGGAIGTLFSFDYDNTVKNKRVQTH